MGREEEYRKRLVAVRNEVKRRLDYHAQIESLEKDYQKKHLLAWLKDNVHKELVSKQVRQGVQGKEEMRYHYYYYYYY